MSSEMLNNCYFVEIPGKNSMKLSKLMESAIRIAENNN